MKKTVDDYKLDFQQAHLRKIELELALIERHMNNPDYNQEWLRQRKAELERQHEQVRKWLLGYLVTP